MALEEKPGQVRAPRKSEAPWWFVFNIEEETNVQENLSGTAGLTKTRVSRKQDWNLGGSLEEGSRRQSGTVAFRPRESECSARHPTETLSRDLQQDRALRSRVSKGSRAGSSGGSDTEPALSASLGID